ncbi:glycine zipper 2TM domain-containing protein [Thiomonas sp. FB-Cd]|uniref:glycine zipper 2TM domain-containing protein n=1 Tax=Thiomonas sp. FB-Cd TaxID=1158292 RepID=UPI0004DF39D7|nr:glycine zipper 2TM domain-containing protein [Thiomonas sp. FB-Cd]
MKLLNGLRVALGLVAILLLGGCASPGYPSSTSYPTNTTGYAGYGVIQSVELVKQSGTASSGIGVGTIAGGVVGGILGNQVGSGTGQTAATIGGVAAGAYLGHQLEKNQQGSGNVYQFTVRMDNGSYQTLTQSTSDNFQVGERVRVQNGALMRP